MVYMMLSVSFIQMLKALTPVSILIFSAIFRIDRLHWDKMINVAIISLGVMIASFGEIQFDWLGFIYQILGIIFESLRLVMINVLLAGKEFKMGPLTSLYYYAPVNFSGLTDIGLCTSIDIGILCN
jgi:drug/metabolite transporter (DMT)-like permease